MKQQQATKSETVAPRARRSGIRKAKYRLGQVVRHRHYPFRGIIFDVDPVFSSSEEWWQSIPAQIRPRKNQPFYHLLAENSETEYVAYVSEQNLVPDTSRTPLRHPQVSELFRKQKNGGYRAIVQSH
ncbi:MAG: heat shock protein HspQ [Hyphomicrobiaceae bacterium]